MSSPLDETAKLVAVLDDGFDLVIGSRAVPGAELAARQHPLRELLGKTFNGLLRTLTGLPFRDTQCGFKLLRADMARRLAEHQRIDGYLYDAELCLIALQLGFRVAEVPVRWSHNPDSRVRVLRSAPGVVLDLLRLGRLARRPLERAPERTPAPLGRRATVTGVRSRSRPGGLGGRRVAVISRSRWMLALVACGLALTGAAVVEVARRHTHGVGSPPAVSWILFGLAALALFLAVANPKSLVPASSSVRGLADAPGRRALACFAGSVLLAGSSIPLFVRLNDSDSAGKAGWGANNGSWLLYLASLACFAAGVAFWRGASARPARPWNEDGRRHCRGGSSSSIVAVLSAVALALRFPALGSIPHGLWFDEAQNGLVGQGIGRARRFAQRLHRRFLHADGRALLLRPRALVWSFSATRSGCCAPSPHWRDRWQCRFSICSRRDSTAGAWAWRPAASSRFPLGASRSAGSDWSRW